MHRSYFSLEPIEVEELFFLLCYVEQSENDTISNETVYCGKFDRRRYTLRHPKSSDVSPHVRRSGGRFATPLSLLTLWVVLHLTSSKWGSKDEAVSFRGSGRFFEHSCLSFSPRFSRDCFFPDDIGKIVIEPPQGRHSGAAEHSSSFRLSMIIRNAHSMTHNRKCHETNDIRLDFWARTISKSPSRNWRRSSHYPPH